jgi:hypothetical protein
VRIELSNTVQCTNNQSAKGATIDSSNSDINRPVRYAFEGFRPGPMECFNRHDFVSECYNQCGNKSYERSYKEIALAFPPPRRANLNDKTLELSASRTPGNHRPQRIR